MARNSQKGENATLYNQVRVKNIHTRDFVFKVAGEEYLIEAGETRSYPKFMVRPLVKHLIDKIILTKDSTGKSLRNEKLRSELAAKIVISEQAFTKPRTPSDRELVEEMNAEPELDRALRRKASSEEIDKKEVVNRLKNRLPKDSTKKPNIPQTAPDDDEEPDDLDAEIVEDNPEDFDQIKEEKIELEGASEIPSREEMLKYATDVLKMDITEEKTEKMLKKLTDEQLYEELGLGEDE